MAESKRNTIVFFHAFPFSGEMWRDQVTALSQKYTCVTPDLPGFGKNPRPEYPVTFEAYVDSMIDFLKKEKVENAVWCGLSMGGYLALRLYEREPGLCRALILCDTKSGADGNEAKLKRWATIQALKRSRQEFTETQWKALIGESSQTKVDLKKRFSELLAQTSDAGVMTGLVALATRTDTTEKLGEIRVPTLLLVGEEDNVTPMADSQAMSQKIQQSEIQIMKKTGHLSNIESPDEFNSHLERFLESLD